MKQIIVSSKMNFINSETLVTSRSKLNHSKSTKVIFDANQCEQTISERRQFDLGSGAQTDIDEYQRYILLFNFENWFTQISEVTFPTQVLEMSQEDGRALIECYNRIKNNNEDIDAAQALNGLHKKIETCMNTFTQDDNDGFFVKTSCRSAKDYADLDQLRILFNRTMSSLPVNSNSNSENYKMIAMSFASMELLKMRSATQVIQNFMRSERIWHDMHLALSQGSSWNEAIIVRHWVNIEPDMEFRCFVCAGKLTAISQYRHLVYFPRLHANEEYLKHTMTHYLQATLMVKLDGLFPRNDYIVDLALELKNINKTYACLNENSLDGCIKQIWAVEVNPFYETTDACMFSWSKDAAVLMTEKIDKKDADIDNDVEVRIRHSPARGCSSLIFGAWREILDE